MEKPSIEIKEISMRFIYIRHRGAYSAFRKKSRSFFNELFRYAAKYDLITENITKVLTVYDDNPFITPSDKLRLSVAMTVNDYDDIVEEGAICEGCISGKFAVAHFNLAITEHPEAWQYMYKDWLEETEYTLRDAIPFELYVEEPAQNMHDKTLMDIYIPIE